MKEIQDYYKLLTFVTSPMTSFSSALVSGLTRIRVHRLDIMLALEPWRRCQPDAVATSL